MNYVPDQGDIVTLDFHPQSGKEAMGRRPGLVLSRKPFNEKTGFAFICPITKTERDYVFHVKVPSGLKCAGQIEVDQARSLDYVSRKARYCDKLPEDVLAEVLNLYEPIFWAI